MTNNLNRKIDELELSIRVMSGLKKEGIDTIGNLVKLTEGEFLRIPNFGIKSFNEIREVLSGMNLELGAKKEDSEEDKKSDLLKDLRFDVIDKSEVAFKKSCDEIVHFRKDNQKISHQQVIDIFTQHKQIVGAYERSLKDLFNQYDY